MNAQPSFFEPIRVKAAARWDQLEQDPELAGPWHQLFTQVQSPRHVVSELLQNADDAGATEASVRIDNGDFVFEHNGGDFTEEQFASLCRFGYSNKRALHTIGFRGIGFKSTFSLGDCVEVFTPTLAISFHCDRFTEPRWLSEDGDTDGWTRVRVAMGDQHRQDEVAKNLEEWLKSPLSLLFFRTIHKVQIGERTVHWRSLGPGPIQESERWALDEKDDDEVLVLRSNEEAFPEEALVEIREEHRLGVEDAGDFPPCSVELALGAKGGLFAVLPTGVQTQLPFACNAPFIPDPARTKIKDPGMSPTNRWLLQRAGELAGSAMLRWLNQGTLSTSERAPAYRLLPDVTKDDSSPEGACTTIVEKAFERVIAGQPVLLTDSGELVEAKAAVILPGPIFDIWPTEPIVDYLDEVGRPALCRSIPAADAQRLRRWALAEQIDKPAVLTRLQSAQPPKPANWPCLLNLWAYVASDITSYSPRVEPTAVRIVPVKGSKLLFAAAEVVRLSARRLLKPDEDWTFLAPYLRILDPSWTRYLAENPETVANPTPAPAPKARDAAVAVLKELGLDGATDINDVVAHIAGKFLGSGRKPLTDSVRLAQIVAKLDGRAPKDFEFCTRDGEPHSAETGVVWDRDGLLSPLLPGPWKGAHLLHAAYTKSFVSCSRDEWRAWAESERSGLHLLPPIESQKTRVWSRSKFETRLRELGYGGACWYHYQTSRLYPYQNYCVVDFDFNPVLSDHWRGLPDDHDCWRVITRLLMQVPDAFWRRKWKVDLEQTSSNGQSTHPVSIEKALPAAWVRALSERSVLNDTRGFRRKPSELFRRTPETEALLDVEPFVDARIDTEAARPLLDLLGVRSTPTGPDALLDRLHALAGSENPPVHEVDKWYRGIDKLVETCSTADLEKITQAFSTERLILTQDGAWAAAPGVFLTSDEEDVPGAAVVRPAVSDLMLWRKVGVAERPTTDLAMAWLRTLPSGQGLTPEDARRVRNLLGRHSARIWDECAHWLNLAGAWVPVDGLAYALTMQSLVPWDHLFPWITDKTADLRRLTAEHANNPPFSRLQVLAQMLEPRLDPTARPAGRPEKREWLAPLGEGLSRARFESDDQTQRIRALATRLAQTSWCRTSGLSTTPFVDGTPAGTPRRTDVVWHDRTLYVDDLPNAKLARRVPEEIGRAFARSDIQAALDYSFERPPTDVQAYLEENFQLAEAAGEAGEHADGDTTTESAGPDAEMGVEAAGAHWADVDRGELTTSDAGPGGVSPGPDDAIDWDEPDDSDDPTRRRRRRPSHGWPEIIERFAMAHGFRQSIDGRYRHADGSWIGRADGMRPLWERWTANGDLVRYYWPRDHCLEREPLQLDADIWGLIDQHPETYALILANTEGGAVEVTGTRLLAMLADGELTLFPATYRLVVRP